MSQENVVRWSVADGVGQIIVNSPPVNALSTAVRRGIAQALAALQADPGVKAAVLVCEGRTFFAGADITEFGKPPQLPTLHEVMASIENAPWPVIGAIHGTALGGGLEVALVCHHRIAVPSARLGLPEVKLGLLPGGGGTQRLPRLLGVEAALDMMLSGDPISAEKALEVGLIDRMADEGQLLECALAFARDLVTAGQSPTRIRDRQDHLGVASRDPQIFERARAENARVRRGLLAPQLIVKAVEAAVTMDFEQGLAREWELFRELEDGRESAALRHIFFAERESAKVPGVKSDTPALALETALIVGDGAIATRWETNLRKAQLSVSRIADAVPITSAANLVILAQESGQNPEELNQLSGALGPETLVVLAKSSHASETDAAPRLPHPHRVLGATLANVEGGRLLEIDIGSKTSADTVQTALKLARRCQLVPVAFQTEGQSALSRLRDAFAAARKALQSEGVSPADITAALEAFGFAGTNPVTDADGQSAIVRPLLAAVANAGACLLDEGIALRPSDIDITAVEGLGWPSCTGGPMFWLDQTDMASVIADLHRLEAVGGTLFSPAARVREAMASTAATAAN